MRLVMAMVMVMDNAMEMEMVMVMVMMWWCRTLLFLSSNRLEILT